MSNAENDSPMLRLQLMIAKQERDEGYKERDTYKKFYLIMSQNLAEVEQENQELQQAIQHFQDLVAGYQSGDVNQRLSTRIIELETQLDEEVNEKEELDTALETAQNDMKQKVMSLEQKLAGMKQKVADMERDLNVAREKFSETAHQLESKEEELASVTVKYNMLQTQYRELCHRMQRRRWLYRWLQKNFHQRKTHSVQQASSIVHCHPEHFRSVAWRRRAVVLMECLRFAFYVAKQKYATHANIMHGRAVSFDDEWEVIEDVANPEGMSPPHEHPFPEEEKETEQRGHSELVLSSGMRKVRSRVLAVDVHREKNETQHNALHTPQSSSSNLVCPSSVDHSSCWQVAPAHTT